MVWLAVPKILSLLAVCFQVSDCSKGSKKTHVIPCRDRYLCENVTGYPSAEINQALQKSSFYRNLLGPGGVQPPNITASPPSKMISFAAEGISRMAPSNDPAFQQACDVDTALTQYPQAAKNVQNITKYVVNVQGFRQPVSTERCRHENQPCNNLTPFLTSGVTTSCMSNTVTISLVTYDDIAKTLSTDRFPFPGSCICFCKNNNNG